MKHLIGFLFVINCSFILAQDETLEAPGSSDQTICGAGYLTLTATSNINDDELEFEWYESLDNGQLQFLGALNGATGTSQFITSFLISDKNFAVRVKLGSLTSPYTFVKAEILNEASIVQQPEIQLCGEAYLEVDTEMDSIESYQWQILVPDEFGQSFFQDLTTESSDSVILIAVEVGFYRAVVTDSTGCQAISSEVEVTNDRVVQFISSVVHCYDDDITDSDIVTLSSSYGRAFTEFEWEQSLDSINFTSISTAQSIDVSKPTLQAFDTAYYRLIITEQNCSNDTTIAVYWRPAPEGTISHIDPLIGDGDFSYCDTDAEAVRTLRFESTAPNIVVNWFSVNYAQNLTLDNLKSYSGETGPEDYLSLKNLLGLQIAESFLGAEDEVILEQKDGAPAMVDGGLIFAVVTDTIADCSTVTNGIFADTAFPFPIYGGNLAYNYEFGLTYVPACLGDELVFTSYDQTADAYSWQRFDPVSGTNVEISTNPTLSLVSDEDFEGGTYFLEVTKNGCTGLSEGFNVEVANPPTVEITNVDEEAVACNEIPGILLVGRGSADVVEYQWFYSVDDVNFVEAPGDSSQHFYTATLNGYYKLSASNAICAAETESVRVEIPEGSGPDFVEVALEGETEYCEGDEVAISCNYESSTAGYFWYYSFFQLDGDEPSIELVELGGTASPGITLDSRSFGSNLTEPLTLYFYILVIDGSCIVGSTNTPFAVTISPSPNIEIVFTDAPSMNEVFLCEGETIDEGVIANNLSAVSPSELNYLWTRYNPSTDDYDTLAGETSQAYTITEPGRYRSIAVTSDNACSSVSNSLDVMKLPTAINGESLYCLGNDILLEAYQEFAPDLDAYTYQWYRSSNGNDFSSINGETTHELTIEPGDELYGPGYFFYEATFGSCTVTSDTLEINENTDSFSSNLLVEVVQEKGIPFEASIQVESNLEQLVFDWQPADFISFTDGSRAVFNIPETYSADSVNIQITVSAENGCEVTLDQWVRFEETNELTFSKFVSPNGDGLNDVFKINGIDPQIVNQLNVVDSWGNELFSYANYYNQPQESEALVQSLNGEGVYYYVFSLEGSVIKGSFYLKK